jgi:hypothetical protein
MIGYHKCIIQENKFRRNQNTYIRISYLL